VDYVCGTLAGDVDRVGVGETEGGGEKELNPMGERVVVNPGASGAEPTPAVPLDYGHGTHAGDVWRRFTAATAERMHGAAQFAGMVIAMIGGPRQLAFAVGLMFLAGGVTDAMSRWGDGVFAACVGGFLVGLAVPVPKRKG
jgi:hypothetical protein